MKFSTYVKCLKKYAKNKKISDEAFVNAVLKPYIDAGEVDNKKGEELILDKSRVSLLMNNHDDIPSALRMSLSYTQIYEWTEQNYEEFMSNYLDEAKLEDAVNEFVRIINNDERIIDKDALLSKAGDKNVFLADLLIETIKTPNNGFDSNRILMRNSSYYLMVEYGNLFKYAFRKRSKEKCICVIPVDANFHTHVTRKYEADPIPQVSEKSIHGQWLIRWEQSGESIDGLHERIIDNIRNYEGDKKYDKSYPLGTISVVENKNTIYYLVAISKFDKNNTAHSSVNEIKKVIDILSEFYDKYGQGYNLYIPLLGTGKSRSGISMQESFELLIDNYRNNISRIQGNIYIVIYKDFEGEIRTEV